MSLKFTARARFLIYIYIYVAYILTRCPIARRFRVVSARRQPRLISLHRKTNRTSFLTRSNPLKGPLIELLLRQQPPTNSSNFLTRQLSTSIDTKKKNLEKNEQVFFIVSIDLDIIKKFKVVRSYVGRFGFDYFWDHDAFQNGKFIYIFQVILINVIVLQIIVTGKRTIDFFNFSFQLF